MKIRVIKPGLLSTVQDLGRYGFLSQAVPVSGAVDILSARLANIAVGNSEGSAVIELTYANFLFIAETDLLIAYAGDGAFLQLNSKQLPADRPIFIPAGAQINSISNPKGSRTYLAVTGGWNVPEILGSCSTYLTAGFGGHDGRQLQAGDVLYSIGQLTPLAKKIMSSLQCQSISQSKWSVARQLFLAGDKHLIRIVPAQEFTWFGGASILDFLSMPYTLGVNSNRMGYNVKGPVLKRIKNDELLSTAVTPGTIQVTGDGSMIMLMADCQTTGGYPRIAQVAAVDLPLCGQLKPGDEIYFKEISRQNAEMLYIEREQEIHKLKATLKGKFL